MKLFIPDKIKIGFNARSDTYTKKLGYVIYYDEKGKLRKERSWESWRNKEIPPVEFDNVPTEGFVLNRHGGHTGSRSWYDFGRNAFIRVYDPRDFEFEIGLENLLFILRECDCTKGKGLEGKFVYAWQGTDLVLLPESSTEYQESLKYTSLQSQKISLKELVEGYSYETKDQTILVYLGRFFKHYKESWRGDDRKFYRVFHDGKNFVFLKDSKILARLHSDTVATNYAELVDSYNKSKYGSKPKRIFLKEFSKPKEGHWRITWNYEQYPGVFLTIEEDKHTKYIKIAYQTTMENDKIEIINTNRYIINQNKTNYYRRYDEEYNPTLYEKIIADKTKRLCVELESGAVFELLGTSYINGVSY